MFGEYLTFIDVVPDTSLLYTGQYNYGLVFLSVSIAVFSAYTALFVAQFAERIEERKRRLMLLTLGGITFGVGVWSMHFIGMLGFSLLCGVAYDPWITAFSMVPGILASIFSLHLISSRNKSTRMLLTGGVIFGGGIGVMHYSGMAAMRMDAFLRYDLALFLLSILVAVLLAMLALWVRYGLIRLFPALEKHVLLIASLVMGGAVSGMHYIAMGAAYFLIGDVTKVSNSGIDPTMLAIVISGVTAFLIGIVLIYVFKQFTQQIEHINSQLHDANNKLKFQKVALDHHAIVSMTDVKGNITYVNKNFSEASKYERDELIGKNHRIINSHEHPESFFKGMWHTIANGNVWQGEIKNRARDGSIYWVYSTIVPFLNEQGKPYQYISVRTDITSIKNTEALLQQAKEDAEKANLAKSKLLTELAQLNDELENRVQERTAELAAIIKGSTSGIVTIDESGIIQSFSQAAENIFGWSAEDCIGQNVKMLMPDPYRNEHDGYLRNHVKTGETKLICSSGREVSGLRKDGSQFPLFMSVNRAELSDNTIFVGTLNDISEQKNAQKQLIQSERLASLGQMVAGIAHEINTPLGTAVTNVSELEERSVAFSKKLEKGISKADMDNYLQDCQDFSGMAKDNLLRAAELVRSFKLVAVDQSSEEDREFDLKQHIEATLTTIHHEFKRTDIRIKLDCADGLLVNSYPGAISQIITNLAHNSLIHGFNNGSEAGQIQIRASSDVNTGQIILNYSDDGRGLDKEQRKKIFDPFFTTRRNQGGSGLGMNVVHNLVTDVLRGSIALESNIMQGVHFQINIPQNVNA